MDGGGLQGRVQTGEKCTSMGYLGLEGHPGKMPHTFI